LQWKDEKSDCVYVWSGSRRHGSATG
jgi:hypothetical protein